MSKDFDQINQEVLQQIKEVNELLTECKNQVNSLKFKDKLVKQRKENTQQIEIAQQQIHHIINEYFSHISHNYVSIYSQYPNNESKNQTLQKIDSLKEYVKESDDKLMAQKFSEDDIIDFKLKMLEMSSNEACQEVSVLENQLSKLQKSSKLNVESLPSIKINKKVVEGLYSALNEYSTVEWPSDLKEQIHQVTIEKPNYFTTKARLPIINESKESYGAYNLNTNSSQAYSYILGPQENIEYQSSTIIDPDGQVYCIGGVTNQGMISSSFHKLDTNTHKLLKLPNMLVKRAGASVCLAQGQIFVMGGRTDHSVKTKLCEVYNIENKKWQLISKMNFGKARAACCYHEEKNEIYIFFGSDSYGKLVASGEKYSITDNKWTQISFNNYLPGFDNTFGTAIQINKEQILLFGGLRDSAYFNDQMYFNRNIMLYCTTNDCFSNLPQLLPIDFIPLSNPIIHDQAIFCIGTFMKSLGEKPLLFLEGGFVIKIHSQTISVVNYTPSSKK